MFKTLIGFHNNLKRDTATNQGSDDWFTGVVSAGTEGGFVMHRV